MPRFQTIFDLDEPDTVGALQKWLLDGTTAKASSPKKRDDEPQKHELIQTHHLRIAYMIALTDIIGVPILSFSEVKQQTTSLAMQGISLHCLAKGESIVFCCRAAATGGRLVPDFCLTYEEQQLLTSVNEDGEREFDVWDFEFVFTPVNGRWRNRALETTLAQV